MGFIYSMKDNYRAAVEAATGGKNTVMHDDKGYPSIMVAIPRFNLSDVIDGAPNTPHPAFIVNGVVKDVIYISKYQNIVHGGRAYSLPMQDPGAYMNFDQAKGYCESKGAGWHLMTNAEWAALALWCKKNNKMPRGNNYAGADAGALYETGAKTYDWVLNYNWNNRAYKIDGANYYHTGRTATGSGPATWSHDGTNEGVFDLNGNVWEWVGGMRLKDGEIQVIPDNNAALAVDQSDTSVLWKAILQDGTLIAPGTANTLKYDATNADGSGAAKLNTTVVNRGTDATYMFNEFEVMAAQAGVTAPTLLKALGLYPVDAAHGDDGFWARNNGERLPLRGGDWNDGANAGVFALYLYNSRAYSGIDIGFRAAFCNL